MLIGTTLPPHIRGTCLPWHKKQKTCTVTSCHTIYIYISIKSLYHARRIMTCVPNSPSVELCVFVAKADKASAAAARADDRKAQEALGWFVWREMRQWGNEGEKVVDDGKVVVGDVEILLRSILVQGIWVQAARKDLWDSWFFPHLQAALAEMSKSIQVPLVGWSAENCWDAFTLELRSANYCNWTASESIQVFTNDWFVAACWSMLKLLVPFSARVPCNQNNLGLEPRSTGH